MIKVFVLIFKIFVLSGLGYYLLSDVDMERLLKTDLQISYPAIILFFFVFIGIYLLASLRFWTIIGNKNVNFRAGFESVIIGYSINNIMPARLGEVARLVYLKVVYKTPTSISLSAVVVERFFDLNIVVVLVALFAMNFVGSDSVEMFLLMLLIGWVILIASMIFKSTFFLVLDMLPWASIVCFVKSNVDILHSKLKPRGLVLILMLSLLFWAYTYFMYYLFFNYAVSYDLDFQKIIILFVACSVAYTLPVSPGAVGVFEAAAVFVLTKYGIEKESALVSAIIFHFLIVAPTYIALAMILIKKNLSFSELTRRKNG